MARIKKEKVQVEEKPEIRQYDIDKYMEALKEMPQYRFDGMLISPRERYCISLGALKIQNGEMVVLEPTIMQYVDELEKRRPREKFSPPKKWWDEIRVHVNVMETRVVHAPSDDNEVIPF